MHDSAFRERRGMRPLEWRAGRVSGYRLRFNLDGRAKGRAAPANLCADKQPEVWGVLYRIRRRDLLRLDSTEGVPGRRYRHLWVEAEDSEGNTVQAVTYIADGNEIDGYPSLRYITLLREGAPLTGALGSLLGGNQGSGLIPCHGAMAQQSDVASAHV
jgi:gamma-glutamylcyclotransferase